MEEEGKDQTSQELPDQRMMEEKDSYLAVPSNENKKEEPSLSNTQILLNAPPAEFEKVGQKTRRLIVQSICLENFKSYQGRQEIGPFDDVKKTKVEICGCDWAEWFRKVELA